jgi:peptide chain release factor 2
MEELQKRLENFRSLVDNSLEQLGYKEKLSRLDSLKNQTSQADFWHDQIAAKKINKEISRINSIVNPWRSLCSEFSEIDELSNLNDPSLKDEIAKNLGELENQYQGLKKQLLFNRPYDDYCVFMAIYAGAGGTDAQDWANMLLRMYSRWVESKKDFNMKVINVSVGEEAGIKTAQLEIEGPYAYGLLKSEHGVHRLVRLSPFNADNLRQTSFAKIDILPKIDEPAELNIDDKDIKIDVYKSGGKGGQSVNTTDSAVRITHVPTGVVVAIQNERSQLQNKETAMSLIRSKLAQLQLEQHKIKLEDIKGPNEAAAWGNQIRNYVLHPYNMVKDLRTNFETSDTKSVLDGNIDGLLYAFLEQQSVN